MNKTDQSLIEQMRITDFEISSRKVLFSITPADEAALKGMQPHIVGRVNDLVDRFYEMQTASPEISLLIGDSDTLKRLRTAQGRYILDLFSGYYDVEYVNNRLRIGLVHKRIGVEPKLYLTAVQTLQGLLIEAIDHAVADEARVQRLVARAAAREQRHLAGLQHLEDGVEGLVGGGVELAVERRRLGAHREAAQHLPRRIPEAGGEFDEHHVAALQSTARVVLRRHAAVGSLHVVDADGRTYVDFLAGIAVGTLGHAHPAIVEAVSTQVATLVHSCALR